MARLRYTDRFTFRLSPRLREALEHEAEARDANVGELVRDILLEHAQCLREPEQR